MTEIRWNVLYILTLAVFFVGALAYFMGSGEALWGLAGAVLGSINSVSKELVNPSANASEFTSTILQNGDGKGCPNCKDA